MKRLIVALLFLPLPALAQPLNCADAVNTLAADLSADERAAFLEMTRDQLAEHRDGFGAGIAAEFGLLSGNGALAASCTEGYEFPREMGASDRAHPYTISLIIMQRVWDKLHGAPKS